MDSGLFDAMKGAATLEDKFALVEQARAATPIPGADDPASAEVFTPIVSEEGTSGGEATIAPTDQAANAVTVQIAAANGLRSVEDGERILREFNFGQEGSSAKVLGGSPDDREMFNTLLARAAILDPKLEELLALAEEADIGIVVDLENEGLADRLLFGGAGAAVANGDPDATVQPLVQHIDMSDLRTAPSVTTTNAPGAAFGREVALGHEIRELIGISLENKFQKVPGDVGYALFQAAHAAAVAAEENPTGLLLGERAHRIRGSGPQNGTLPNSPPGTMGWQSFTLGDGRTVTYHRSRTNDILQIDETPAPRQVPTSR